MAGERLNTRLTAQDEASAKVKGLEKRFNELGGQAALTAKKVENKLSRSIKQLQGPVKKGGILFSRFTSGIALGNIAATAATSIFRGVVGALKGTIDAAANTQKEWGLVTASLERHGLAVDGNIDKIKGFADEMQTLTGVADEEYGGAVRRMIDAGQDIQTSFDAVTAAADIAASTGKATSKIMNQISDAIIKEDVVALEKWTGAIDTSLPFAEKLDIALERINENFGGAAAASADTYAVKMAVMGQKFGDLQEKIGGLVLPILTKFATIASSVIDTVIGWFTKLEESPDGFIGSLGSLSATVQKVFDAIRGYAESYWAFAKALWDSVFDVMKEVWDNIQPAIEDAFSGIGELLATFFDKFKLIWDKLIEIVKSPQFATAMSVLGGVISFVITSAMGLGNVIATVLTGVVNIIWTTGQEMINIFKDTWDVIKSVFTGGFDEAWDKLKVTAMAGAFNIKNVTVEAGTEVNDALVEMADNLNTSIDNSIDNVVDSINRVPEAVEEANAKVAQIPPIEIPVALPEDEIDVFAEKITTVSIDVPAKINRAWNDSMSNTLGSVTENLGSIGETMSAFGLSTTNEFVNNWASKAASVKGAVDQLSKFNKIQQVSNKIGKVATTVTKGLSVAMKASAKGVWDAIKASATFIASMVKEIAHIAILIGKHIALAAVTAAKAVAGIPFIGPALAIGAAVAIVAGLTSLLGGFDLRANDETGFLWGQDLGRSVMAGFASVTSAPGFGNAIVGDMRGGPRGPLARGGGNNGSGGIILQQTVVFENAIITDSSQISVLSSQIEDASYEGLSRAVFRPARLTGGPSESYNAPNNRRTIISPERKNTGSSRGEV